MNTNNIPLAVELEILSWLPVESVLRFRSVSKTWNEATREPSFAYKHHTRSRTRERINFLFKKFCSTTLGHNGILYDHKVTWKPSIVMTTLHSGQKFVHTSHAFPPWLEYITGSCNGLVCITSYDFMHQITKRYFKEDHTYVCNPTTQEYLQLDLLWGHHPFKRQYVVSGFGYDPKRREYKVVMFDLLHGSRLSRSIAVCTIPVDRQPGPWRILPDTFPGLITSRMAVRVGTRLHWDLYSVSPQKEGFITALSFDVHHEQFRHMNLPVTRSWPRQDDKYLMLSELNGCFAVVHYAKLTHAVQVWVMEDYGNDESWILRFSFTRFLWVSLPVFLLWEEDRLLVCSDNYVYSYDPSTDKGELILKEDQRSNFYCSSITPFVSSLVSLKGAVKCWMNK